MRKTHSNQKSNLMIYVVKITQWDHNTMLKKENKENFTVKIHKIYTLPMGQ